jgi:high-affinity Fe2+/Pb2+ permease
LNSIWWKVSALLKRLLHCQLLDWKRKKEKQIKQCVQSSVQSVDQKENILKASIFFLCLLSTETWMHNYVLLLEL